MPAYDLSNPQDAARFIKTTPRSVQQGWIEWFKDKYWREENYFKQLSEILNKQ